uniref:Uncharacterized protein n=1 Tax=Anopheles atroparvus TaxID=41427 RepID=A0A182J5Y9_ANOAO
MIATGVMDSAARFRLPAFLLRAFFLSLYIWSASGTPFDGYIYPTPTTEASFTGYDYVKPSCPLLEEPPPCTASATILTVPVQVNVTETIVTFLKVPTTVTTTLIVPTTSTEVQRSVETRTSFQTTTYTATRTLPVVTSTATETSTIVRLETVTSPVVRVEHVTERYPVVEYRTDTVTRTSTCTVTELFPTTYYSTFISTSYAPPLTDTSYLTETSFRTRTATQLSTLVRTETVTSRELQTLTETVRATRTLTLTATVSATCAPPPPPLNNEYLPVAAPSNDYLPPRGAFQQQQQQQAAEQRLRSNFVLPEDLLLPPHADNAAHDLPQTTVSVTVTKTLEPVTLTTTRDRTVTRATDAADATAMATRLKSVLAFDQRVTKLVTITPTLTSYIYMDTVTVTATKPAALRAG